MLLAALSCRESPSCANARRLLRALDAPVSQTHASRHRPPTAEGAPRSSHRPEPSVCDPPRPDGFGAHDAPPAIAVATVVMTRSGPTAAPAGDRYRSAAFAPPVEAQGVWHKPIDQRTPVLASAAHQLEVR